MYLGVDHRFGSKLLVDLDYRFVDGLYADYNLDDSQFASPDNPGALQPPSYGLVDLGATFYAGNGWSVRMNINNLFDTTYIAESNSNQFVDSNTEDTWNGIDVRNYVWFGFGTTWNDVCEVPLLKHNFKH